MRKPWFWAKINHFEAKKIEYWMKNSSWEQELRILNRNWYFWTKNWNFWRKHYDFELKMNSFERKIENFHGKIVILNKKFETPGQIFRVFNKNWYFWIEIVVLNEKEIALKEKKDRFFNGKKRGFDRIFAIFEGRHFIFWTKTRDFERKYIGY